MRIVIAGGSGFIGQKLTTALLDEGHEIIILTRNEKPSKGNISYVKWLQPKATPEAGIGFADAFINLAGVSINEGRWTTEHQKQIYTSRMTATDELLRIISCLQNKPSVLINASAIGIYPASETAIYTDESTEVASDFLARTIFDWEKKAATATTFGIRTVFTRFGIVLGNEGGALPLMSLPYKLLAGGTVGSGKQWLSWVHVTDVVRAIQFSLNNPNMSGAVNVTAPSATQMKSFGQTIGTVLHRPHWFPTPSFLMKVVLGKKSALVLEGQHVIPQKLLDNGFEFSYPTLTLALENLLK